MQELINKIEAYGFECEGGPLANCVEWNQLKGMVALLSAVLPAVPVKSKWADRIEEMKKNQEKR